MKKLPILYPLIGTIIGASFFALPFIFHDQNFIVASGLFLLISIISIYTNYIYSKIIVNTHGQHQLPGYSEIYLGKKYKDVVSIMTLLGGLGSNLAYIIIIVSFVHAISPITFPNYLIAIFFVILFGFSTLNNKIFNGTEKYLTFALMTLLVLLTVIMLLKTNDYSNITTLLNRKIAFLSLPTLLGITLAANTGFGILPELKDKLSNAHLSKTMILNSVIPVILYVGFIIAVIVHSTQVSENALSGLTIDKPLIILGAIIGLLAVATSYQSLSIVSIDTLTKDFNFSIKSSIVVVIIIPLILYLMGINQLALVLGTVGGLFTAFSHLIVHLIYKVKYGHNFIFELFSYILIFMIVVEVLRIILRFF